MSGPKRKFYRDLQVADDLGRAVLLISSDFDEVEKVCHRALIFSRGKLIAEIDRKNINVANLTSLAAGARGRHLNPRSGGEGPAVQSVSGFLRNLLKSGEICQSVAIMLRESGGTWLNRPSLI
jgi:ABC-type uncharacterized transport system ATPase subunit